MRPEKEFVNASGAHAERVFVAPRARWANANIHPVYHLEGASWVWCGDWPDRAVGVVGFRLPFSLGKSRRTRLHVSADQRFELRLDGVLLARGPDRGDPGHWSFSSYEVEIAAGEHRLEANVSWWGDRAPVAQMSVEPGFILSAEGLEAELNTGQAAWEAQRCGGISLRPPITDVYHVVGPGYAVDAGLFFGTEGYGPVVAKPPVLGNPHGLSSFSKRLHPSRLPEQIDAYRPLPVPVCIVEGHGEDRWSASDGSFAGISRAFVGGETVSIGPHKEVAMLFDLDQYHCGYTEFEWAGGAGATITWEWAESLVEEPFAASVEKGNRDEWVGKYFRGFGDVIRTDGGAHAWRSFWWRAGRYVRIVVETAESELLIHRAGFTETRYPFDAMWPLQIEERGFMESLSMYERGLQMCAHETFVDCPYFEQLSYVGDGRLQALCWMTMQADDRLVLRTLEQYDWSRAFNGFVGERFPSQPPQVSVTYSMIWILMVFDYGWWRDDAAFVAERMRGVRALIDEIWALRGTSGLLENLPGWSFVDWIDEWDEGYSPGAKGGSSACVDLFWILALQAAAALEENFGEPELAARFHRLADEHIAVTREAYWDATRGLLMDDLDGAHCSVHAQCLAILAGMDEGAGRSMLEATLGAANVSQPSCYFEFYALEALYAVGAASLFQDQLKPLTEFRRIGLRTPPEKADPARSDCHAWASHPLFHARASLLGVRPAAPGFATVQVAPLGPWEGLRSGRVPHPRGVIDISLRQTDGALAGWIELPPETPGYLRWNGSDYPLKSGGRVEVGPLIAGSVEG